jgi:8-oxo-dGTP pyrophosphatase MutT (NUDIX family)
MGGAGMEHHVWNSKAEVQKIDPQRQPIYATQPHVVNEHLAKYIRNPGAKTKHEQDHGLNEYNRDYAGTKHPMIVKHEGNLFAVEGHHRTSAAIHRGEEFHASVWDADRHGLPNEDDDNKPGWGHDPEGDPYSGLVHHGVKVPSSVFRADDCGFGHLSEREYWMHSLANHDDGICAATHVRKPHSGGVGMGDVLGARRDEGELRFHLTAAWADVRDKATRITREGGVHIAVSSNDGIGGTVRGDNDLYETFLTYVPGSRKVGYWNCGCKWAAYAWGRSAPYRRFEGRMCAHALALQFEAQRQHAFTQRAVEEHDFRPEWMRDKTVVVQHQRVTDRAPAVDHRRAASLAFEPADTVPDERAPVYAIALHGVLAGENPGFVVGVLGEFGASREQARALVVEAQHEAFYRTAGGPLEEFREEILMLDRPEHASGAGPDQPKQEQPKQEHTPGEGEQDDDGKGESHPEGNNNPLDPNLHGQQSQAPSHPFGEQEDGHTPHHTEDAREHASEHGVGVPTDEPTVKCSQCQDQGCGACGGAGQVDLDGHSQIPDQNADAGAYSKGKGMGGGGIPTFSSLEAARRRIAEYTSYDAGPLTETRNPNRHIRSDNPGSTGYATSADPGSWDIGSMPLSSTNLDSYTGKKAKEPDVPTHAGVALMAADTGRAVMLQRSLSDPKDPAGGKWEFPGGGLEPGDHSTYHGGIREWQEETGHDFPKGGTVTHAWRSGPYQGHVVVIPHEHMYDPRGERQHENPDDDNEVVAWLHPDDMKGRPDLRDEVKSGTPWKHLSSGPEQIRAQAGIALIHTEPEPALPTTEGGDEETETASSPAERFRAQMSPEITGPEVGGVGGGTYASLDPQVNSGSLHEIVAAFQASAGARALDAPTAAQRQAASGGGASEPGGGDIAEAARQHLARTAMKDFSPIERRALISEGEGGPRARNFGDLQIEGTHYAEIDDEELLA